MFTLKFFNNKDGLDNWSILSAARYEVSHRKGSVGTEDNPVPVGALVVIYPTFMNTNGVEYQVGMDGPGEP